MQNRARGHPWLSVPGDPDPDLIAEAKVAAGDDSRSVEVVVAGELDMTAAFKLEPEVDRLLAAPGAQRLVLDLAGVTFVDSAGLGALLAIRERTQDLGVGFALVNPSAAVRRMLEWSGTGAMLAD